MINFKLKKNVSIFLIVCMLLQSIFVSYGENLNINEDEIERIVEVSEIDDLNNENNEILIEEKEDSNDGIKDEKEQISKNIDNVHDDYENKSKDDGNIESDIIDDKVDNRDSIEKDNVENIEENIEEDSENIEVPTGDEVEEYEEEFEDEPTDEESEELVEKENLENNDLNDGNIDKLEEESIDEEILELEDEIKSTSEKKNDCVEDNAEELEEESIDEEGAELLEKNKEEFEIESGNIEEQTNEDDIEEKKYDEKIGIVYENNDDSVKENVKIIYEENGVIEEKGSDVESKNIEEEKSGEIEKNDNLIDEEDSIEETTLEDITKKEQNEEDIIINEEINSKKILKTGNNVYWYLTWGGEDLHLCGEEPTVPEYIAGQDHYDKNSVINKSDVRKIWIENIVMPESCESWFEDFENLTSIEGAGLVTSGVESMYKMFDGCTSLTNLDLSYLDTRYVTNMSSMFGNCENLTEIVFGAAFRTNSVTDMTGMFHNCKSLETINLSGFDTSNVESMLYMFDNCKNLTTIDVSNFTINNSCIADNIFSNCPNLSHITISESVSNIINDAGLIGNWKDVSTGIIYNYDGSKTTIPTGIGGEYTNYHVYWYWDTVFGEHTLHLSGTIPTASTYIEGQDNYNKDCVANKDQVIVVIIDNIIHPTNCDFWFNYFTNLTTIEHIEKLDTSEVVNMGAMFKDCHNLINLDVSDFVTSEVVNMESMFLECRSLITLDLSNFDTSKVTDMNRMFSNCHALANLDVSGFDTNNVTNMQNMFFKCSNLTTLDVDGFDTSKVTNLSSMFTDCSSLNYLDVGNFDTQNVTNMSSMFSGCAGLTSIDVSNFDTSNATYIYSMFSGCSNLISVDVSGFNTEKVINMQWMFNGCSSLTSVDVSGFDTSNTGNVVKMFYSCSKLTYLDLSNFNISNTVVCDNMLAGCENLNHIKISESMSNIINNIGLLVDWMDINTNVFYDFDGTHTTIPTGVAGEYKSYKVYWYLTNGNTELHLSGELPTDPSYVDLHNNYKNNCITTKSDITKVVFDNDVKSLNCNSWFYYFENLITIEHIDKLDTSEVVNMSMMFMECYNLASLDLSNFDTSKVTDMNRMFSNCIALETLDVSDFDTKNVTNMQNMFFKCSNLTTLDVDGFDTSKVTNLSNMFTDCSSLNYLDVGNFDTQNVTNMSSMFSGCAGLTSIDVSNFDTSNATYIYGMFSGCSNLTSVDVSGFNTEKVINMQWMFNGCSSLTSVDVSGFDTSNTGNVVKMFYSCSKLTYLDLSNFNIGNTVVCDNMLAGCEKLNHIKISESMSNIINNVGLVGNWTDVVTGNIYNFDSGHTTIPMGVAGEYVNYKIYWYLANSETELHLSGIIPTDPSYITGNDNYNALSINSSNKSSITKIVFDNVIYPSNCERWFKDFTNLNTIENISNFKTNITTNISSMFESCNILQNIDLSSFDVSNVLLYDNMFNGCAGLTYLNISNSVSNIINEVGLTGHWRELTTKIVYDYDTINNKTTIPLGAGNYKNVVYFTVNFETNGGTPKASISVCEQDKIPKPTDVVKSGYTVENWYIDNLLTTAWFFDSDVVTSNMTLYAKWTLATYTIKYNTNGGSGIAPSIDKTYSIDVMLSTPSKVGYIFEGWYTDNNIFLNRYNGTTDLADTQGAVVNIYAKWKQIKYTLVLNPNVSGQTGIVTGNTKTFTNINYEDNITLSNSVPFVSSTFDLVGWSKVSGPNNLKSYNVNQVVSKLAVNEGDIVILYAKWVIATYEVAFNGNSATSGTMQNQKIELGSSTELSPNLYKKAGYSFLGWATASNARVLYKNKAVFSRPDAKKDEVYTLYAKWNKNSSSGGGGGGGGGDIVKTPKVKLFPKQEDAKLIFPRKASDIIAFSTNASWKYNVLPNTWSLSPDKNHPEMIVINEFVSLVSKDDITGQVKTDVYYFDEFGNMITGWAKDIYGNMYYFDVTKNQEEGKMAIGWREIGDGCWYCFNVDGKLITNGVTPDGYNVDSNGKLIDANQKRSVNIIDNAK